VTELAKTVAQAERDRALSARLAALLDEMRLAFFLEGTAAAPFASVATASSFAANRAQPQLSAQVAMRAGQLAGLEHEKMQREAERLVMQQTAAKIEQTLPLVAKRASIRDQAAAL